MAETSFSGLENMNTLMCFQKLSDPRVSFFLNCFKLNLEERH